MTDLGDKDSFLNVNQEELRTLSELEDMKAKDVDWHSLFSMSTAEDFSSLLYILTHQRYSGEDARKLWYEILEHNKELEKSLDRDPGLLVAALDYLWNFTEKLDAPYLTEEADIERMREKAIHDELTGLCTRDVFNYCIDKEISNAKRYKTPLALAIIDIDDFKQINDTHGHNKGDEILSSVAKIIKSQMRESDLPIRYGGEEFAIIMRETPGPQATETMDRLRKAIEVGDHDGLLITVSIGVSEYSPDKHKDKETFVDSSDKAMYSAKLSGKNKVVFSS